MQRPVREMQSWNKPTQGIIKINCDVAWEASTRKGGTTVIARGWMGRIVGGRNSTSKDTAVKNLEAKAIMQAVELTIYHIWEDVIVESDAKNIIEML